MRRRCSGIDGGLPFGELVSTLWPAVIFISVADVQTGDEHRYNLYPGRWCHPAARRLSRPDRAGVQRQQLEAKAGLWGGTLPDVWHAPTLAEVAAARARVHRS
jgi:hypothetical protein